MSILVDGYNYIGRSEELRLDDPKSRDAMIYLMGQYCARVKRSLTIVFDGNHFVHHVNRKRRYGRVTVIYTSPIYTADDAIKKMVRKQPPRQRKSMLVVSSDAEVSEYAQRHGTETAKSEDFERTLYRALNAPRKLDRVHVRLSDEEVQEWLKLFDTEGQDHASGRRPPPGITQDTASEKKHTPTAQKKRLHKARRPQFTTTVKKRNGHIDRENVRLSADEVDEWMQIFGVEEEDDD